MNLSLYVCVWVCVCVCVLCMSVSQRMCLCVCLCVCLCGCVCVYVCSMRRWLASLVKWSEGRFHQVVAGRNSGAGKCTSIKHGTFFRGSCNAHINKGPLVCLRSQGLKWGRGGCVFVPQLLINPIQTWCELFTLCTFGWSSSGPKHSKHGKEHPEKWNKGSQGKQKKAEKQKKTSELSD